MPLTFTALKTVAAGARRGVRTAARGGRSAGQVPPPALRAGDVRRPPDAGRPAARRHQAGGQAAGRSGPVRVRRRPCRRCCSPSRAPSGEAGVWCVDERRRADVAAARHSSGRRRPTIEPDELAGAVRRARSMRAPRVPARPALRRRDRPPPRQRGLPPGQAVAVRDDRQARPATAPTTSSTAIRDAVAEGLEYERGRGRHELVEGPPGPRPRAHRRAVPGVRRHGPRRRVLRLHRRTTARRARPAARCSPTTRRASSSSSRAQPGGGGGGLPGGAVGRRAVRRAAAAEHRSAAARRPTPTVRSPRSTSGRCRSSAARSCWSAGCSAST